MAKLHIRPDVVKGHINPEIQGHFSEHLGRCIYEGLYVGENSPIPNTNGMRNDVVEALKEIHIPVLPFHCGFDLNVRFTILLVYHGNHIRACRILPRFCTILSFLIGGIPMQMDTAQYQKYHEEKCHTPADFPYNTYLCTIPLDFQAVSTHWHDEIELIAVKKGEGWVDVNLKRHAVTAGDIVLVLSGQLHAIAQKGCAVMEYETILFRPELLAAENDACYARFLQPFFAETQEIAPVLTPECRNYPAISALLERIDTLCDARPYGYPLAVKGCLFQMFYEIISAERTETEHSLDRKSLAKIKEILSYIADNYSRPISIAEIAGACFYSESYFVKFFKHAMGTSFVQYLNSYRLEKAAKRLRDTSDTILQVAMETGFDSLSYFNRCFKKMYGTTPGKYRSAAAVHASEHSFRSI